MAPKRGGGSGNGISIGGSSSVNNQCKYSGTIGEPNVVARLTVDGLALTAFLIISYLWIWAKKRNPNMKQLLPWAYFGTLLLFSIIYLILSILHVVFQSCYIIGYQDSSYFYVPLIILSELASLLVLAIIMLPLTLHLLRRTGQNTRLVKIINSCAVGLVALLLIPYLAISSLVAVGSVQGTLKSSSRFAISSADNKIATAYYLLYLLVGCIGSVIIILILIRERQHIALSKKSKIWVIFTLIALFINSLAVVVDYCGWVIAERSSTDTTYIAFAVIFSLFNVLTVFGLLKAAETVATPLLDPKNNATYDPDAPDQNMQRRFTYTGGQEINKMPPQYEAPMAYQYQVPQQQYVSPSTEQYGYPVGHPVGATGQPVYEVPATPHGYRG